MFEKILQKIKTQKGEKSNVSERTLTDLARSLELVIVDDAALAKFDFAPVIASIDGNINHHTATAIKTLKEQTPPTPPAPPATPPASSTPPNDMPEWAKQLLEQNKKLSESLQVLQGTKVHENRLAQVQKVLGQAPKWYSDTVTASFGKMKFETDEEFAEYTQVLKTQTDTTIQAIKESGIVMTPPGGATLPPAPDAVSPMFQKALDATAPTTTK